MPAAMIRTVPEAVIKRFPHLRNRLLTEVANDEEFSFLCNDYCSVVMIIEGTSRESGSDWEELTALKSSLEVEILERLTQ